MPGWEAIEQYLTEVEKEVSSVHQRARDVSCVDQRVPQLPVDYTDTMLYTDLSTDSQGTDFLADDEISYNKPTPVEVENSYICKEESSDYCDLDDVSQELSFYHQERYMSDSGLKHNIDDSLEHNYTYDDSINFENPAFRPVTVKSEITDRRCCHSNAAELIVDQLLRSQAFSECAMEIDDTCRCLGVSSNPLVWTPAQVQQWIVWQCRQFNVPQPNMERFCFHGTELCTLDEEYFKLYAPESGSMLFSRLDIWRSVVEQTVQQQYVPPISQIPVPRSPSVSVSPIPDSVSMSPTPQFRDDDSQPSTPPYFKTDDADRLPEEPVHHHRQTIQLWQFLKLLLLDGHYTDCIRWVDRSRGIFKIENSTRVAKLWGKRKNRPAMNYDKLSRSIRQYYKKNIIKKTEHSKRLVYQFCQQL